MRRVTGVVLGVVVTLTICAGSVALAIVAFPLAFRYLVLKNEEKGSFVRKVRRRVGERIG